MIIEDILHRININNSSERLLIDFCSLEAIDGNRGTIKYLNKNIMLSDVYLIGYTSLVVGDVGIILLVGTEKRGVFMPIYNGKIEPKVSNLKPLVEVSKNIDSVTQPPVKTPKI